VGIDGRLLLWLEDFLVSRTMKVGVRGTFSQLHAVLSGVPSGVARATTLHTVRQRITDLDSE